MSKVHISDNFTFRKIFKMTIAPILMMVVASIYSVVDGIFVSNFAGKSSFAAVNLIMPVIMIVAGVGFMFGTGGSAYVSALLGQGEDEKAKKSFSMIIYSAIVVGLILALIVFFFIEPIVKAFASINSTTSQEMIDDAILYGKIMIAGATFYILQNTFQSFFAVAEKATLGFIFTVAAGLTNTLLDYIFIGVLNYGVAGAAIASILGMVVGSVGPFIYFMVNKNNNIFLGIPRFNIKDLLKVAGNGSSEFVSNISTSIVSIVFNIQLLRYIGEDGVSAYGIIMYVSYIFIAIFLGYSIGMAPVVGYNFGSGNKKELRNVFHKSLILITCASLVMVVLSESLASPFAKVFSSHSESLETLATTAMRIYSISFLFCGFSIYGSSFFTALNDGLISAIISMVRTLGFQLISVIVIPLILGVDGVWWAIVIAEACSIVMTIIFWITNQKKYGY